MSKFLSMKALQSNHKQHGPQKMQNICYPYKGMAFAEANLQGKCSKHSISCVAPILTDRHMKYKFQIMRFLVSISISLVLFFQQCDGKFSLFFLVFFCLNHSPFLWGEISPDFASPRVLLLTKLTCNTTHYI